MTENHELLKIAWAIRHSGLHEFVAQSDPILLSYGRRYGNYIGVMAVKFRRRTSTHWQKWLALSSVL